MPFFATLGGVTYTLPLKGDNYDWANGPASNGLNAYLTALATQTQALTLISGSANPAQSGIVRLANTDTIDFRNGANSADIAVGIGAANQLQVGGVDLSGNPVSIWVVAGGQTFATTVIAQVNFSTGEFDNFGAVTAGASWKFTVPAGKAGIYRVACNVQVAGAIASGSPTLALYKNGSLWRVLCQSAGAVPAGQSFVGATEINLAAADFIDVRFSQSSGSTVTLAAGNAISIGRNTP